MRRPKMPRQVRWPFGWVVKIKYRTARQMAALGLQRANGAWVATEMAIYVCRDDHIGDQCETIAHELQHASTDYRHFVDQCVRMPLLHESATTSVELAEEDE